MWVDQGALMSYVFNFKAVFGRGSRDEVIEYQVGTLWKRVSM